MNKDNKTGYFSSNRAGGKGDDDIYSYSLTRPFKQALILEGIVEDKQSNAILPGATVELKDATGNIIQTVVADANGAYSFDLEPEMNYTVAAKYNKYFDNQASFSTISLPENSEKIIENLKLEKDPGIALYCLVTDAKSKVAIEGVKITVIDKATGKEFLSAITPTTGDALKGISDKKVNDQLSYIIKVEKEGYLTKTVTFNQKIAKPGVINVHENIDLSMDRVVTDLSELVKINPINFDLNKYVIRPDAKIELDKIVAIMNKYPDMVVELGSHTDCRASYAYNEKLSDNRAKASAAYIKSKITNPERIYGKGYGESRLLNGCACEGTVKSTCTEEEHAQNRRTEFKVISNGGVKVVNSSTDSFDKK
jgi:outer membrane protein OmpA-like peptidoglycan-associated protein